MHRVPDKWNCPGRSWGGSRVILCNRTSRFQASLPRKMESAVSKWEIPNKSKRILQEDWSRRKVKLISQKYFNLIVYLWSIFKFVGTGCFVQVSKFGKYYSHLPIELIPFLVRGQHTPIHKRFLKNTTNNIRLLSLTWIRKGSCQSRTLDLLLCKLYSYWGIILLYFFRYLRSIAYREFTRLVHG